MKAKADSANGVPLSGDIKQMTVPWLFQALSTGSKTGTAVFEYVQEGTAENVVKKVFFSKGDITFASSNIAADRLGDRLLTAGRLTQAQFDASTEIIKKTGKRQGSILVELGFIKPQDLVEGVKEQVKHILQSLFAVRIGTYRFTEGPLPLADIIPLQMSTGNVILECVNAMPWESVRKALPSPTTVIRPATDPKNLFQDAQLNVDERAVLALIDGQRRIEEVCSLSGVGDFNALRTIHLLLALRMAELGEMKAEEAEFARDAVKRPTEPDLVMTREMILEVHSRIDAMDHYQALRIDANATLPEIKRAYFRMAKAYHPDRHFDPAMADIKDKLEHLFHSVHQAYEVLGSPEKRAEYDRTPHARPAPEPQPQEAPAGEFVEKRAEGYDENYKEKAERAAQWYQKGLKEFKSGNYWGAAESLAWATRLDPIKAHYFFYYGLCLSYIPRRRHEAEENFQKALEIDPSKVEFHIELSNLYLKAGLKMKSIAILNAAAERLPASEKIKEAIVAAETGQVYATLSKTGSERDDGMGGAQEKMTARTSKALERYNAGAKEFRAGNFPLAAEAFAEAARLDPAKAAYHYYLGISLSRVQQRQLAAEPSLRKALELDASKPEFHLALGNFYLKNGLKAKALGVLNNALLRFPGVPKIKEAVVAAGGSVGTAEEAPGEKKGGVFSKLFKGQK
jgi:curved DNA-binding protein CbpA